MSHKFEATVDGIRFLYDGGEVEVDYNASNGDVVRLTIEPLEVKVTDGFRAAVKKACNCDSSSGGGSGGSTGGGVLVVNGTWNDNVCTLNKTWQEIYDGGFGVVEFTEALLGGKKYCPIVDVKEGINEYYLTVIFRGDTLDLVSFSASSASGYPSYTDE